MHGHNIESSSGNGLATNVDQPTSHEAPSELLDVGTTVDLYMTTGGLNKIGSGMITAVLWDGGHVRGYEVYLQSQGQRVNADFDRYSAVPRTTFIARVKKAFGR